MASPSINRGPLAAKVRVAEPQVTLLLNRWVNGEEDALNELASYVHRELRNIARGYLRRESRAFTLQPTALVNEAWLRVMRQPQKPFLNRAQFYGITARLMRQILVDHTRYRQAVKRGGEASLPLLENSAVVEARPASIIEVDQALDRLAAIDVQKARLIEMRFFGGMTAEEIAECSGVAVNAVRRELRLAQAWLCKELRT